MYKALLVAPDGDWVTDFRECETPEEVQEQLADMGSRWYFYPFHAVIRDNGISTTYRQRIIADLTPFGDMEGRTIKTFAKMVKNTPDEELQAILGG